MQHVVSSWTSTCLGVARCTCFCQSWHSASIICQAGCGLRHCTRLVRDLFAVASLDAPSIVLLSLRCRVLALVLPHAHVHDPHCPVSQSPRHPPPLSWHLHLARPPLRLRLYSPVCLSISVLPCSCVPVSVSFFREKEMENCTVLLSFPLLSFCAPCLEN